jgi:hypothetical protein
MLPRAYIIKAVEAEVGLKKIQEDRLGVQLRGTTPCNRSGG